MRQAHVMSPEHPRWRAFVAQLDKAPRCAHTLDNAKAILRMMPGIDVTRSLLELHERGFHCDCSILFGLGAGWKWNEMTA